MRGIDKHSDIPLYKQIMEVLIEEIECGSRKSGDKILPEQELAELYDISRMTARQAINELVRQRLLVRKRGFGTYVAAKHVQRTLWPNNVTGFFEEFRKGGQVLTSRLTENAMVIAPDKVAELMCVPRQTEVYRLSRIRDYDGVPIVYDTSYLSADLWPKLRTIDFRTVSLFETIRKETGNLPHSAEITIHASTADREISEYLRISVGAPMMVATMVNRFENSEIFQVGYLYCPESLDLKFLIGKKRSNRR